MPVLGNLKNMTTPTAKDKAHADAMRLADKLTENYATDLVVAGEVYKVSKLILHELKLEELYQCVEALRFVSALPENGIAQTVSRNAIAALEKGKV